MPAVKVVVHKGMESRVFEFEPKVTAQDIRKQLRAQGFIGVDTSKEAWRFFIYSAWEDVEAEPDAESDEEGYPYEDAVLPLTMERYSPLVSLFGPGRQIYLTNVMKAVNVDLMGLGTDRFFDRNMSCQVVLNQEPGAKEANAGKFQPMHLTHVMPTSEVQSGVYDKVVVCEQGSVIYFNISSWGAAGYGLSIKSEAGEPIVKELYVTLGGDKLGSVSGTAVSRYQSTPRQIVVDATTTLQIPSGQIVQYQRVTVRTWNVKRYKNKSGTFQSDARPPLLGDRLTERADVERELARATILPGEAILPGAPHPGDASAVQFGSTTILSEDTNDIIGQCILHFFVFRSHADAVKVIGQINSPNPAIWL